MMICYSWKHALLNDIIGVQW